MKKILSKISNTIITYLTLISPQLNTRIRYWQNFRQKINLKNPQNSGGIATADRYRQASYCRD